MVSRVGALGVSSLERTKARYREFLQFDRSPEYLTPLILRNPGR